MAHSLRHTLVASVAFLALSAMMSLATAQTFPGGAPVQPPGTVVSPGTPIAAPDTAAKSLLSNAFIVQWLAADNEAEIASLQLAQQRSQNDAVKGLANALIQDHTKFQGQLLKALSTASATAAMNMRQPYIAGFRGEGAPGVLISPVDPIRMKREIDQRALDLTKNELNRFKGVDFDQAFLGSQAAAHLKTLATLQVASNYVSPELKPVLQQGIQATQKHLQDAQSLMKQLEDQKSGEEKKTEPEKKPPQPQPPEAQPPEKKPPQPPEKKQ